MVELSRLNSSGDVATPSSLAPTHLLVDFVKMVFLAVSLVLGAAFNGYSLLGLVRSYRRQRRALQRDVKTAFTLLKLHLTLANLFVLLLYNTTHIGWLWTYEWRGGDLGCRLAHFCFLFAFQSMSNVVAAIAIDRLRNVRKLVAMRTECESYVVGDDALPFVKLLLWGSWISSVLLSIPQLFLWGTADVEADWSQCLSIWDKRRLEIIHRLEAAGASTDIINPIFEIRERSEVVYGIVHLMLVFWVPFLFATASYAVLCVLLVQLSFSGLRSEAARPDVVTAHTPTYGSLASALVGSDMLETQLGPSVSSVRRPLIARPPVPAWRLRMRGKLLKTSGIIMAAYTVSWLPYNVISLVLIANPAAAATDNLDWLKSLIILNALANPFLYGMGRE